MRIILAIGSCCLLCGLTNSSRGQAVQLPTVQSFSVGTTVSVPDRGSAFLGGVNRAAESQVSRGVPGLSKVPGVNRLFRNQALGKTTGASSVRVHATIIDLEEMDRAVLAAAARRRVPASLEDLQVARQADFISRHIARGTVDRSPDANSTSLPSVAEIRRDNQLAMRQQREETQEFMRKAQTAEARGKLGLAKIYYQMAARRTVGEEQQQVLARIQSIDAAREQTKVASR